MAHNFRFTVPFGYTAYYVSKAGADTNDGLTPDNPKATISGARNAIAALSTATLIILIVGSGTYEEQLAPTSRMASGSRIVADGNVVVRGNGSNVFNIFTGVSVENIIFDNYASISLSGQIINCVLKNIPAVTVSSVNANNNIWINCTILGANLHDYSVFVDTTLQSVHVYIRNCYFNANSYLTLPVTEAAVNTMDYNNIMGYIRSGANGTYKDLAGFQADKPSLNTHSINSPPYFNNAAKLDFTLQSSSPHLNAASDNTKNIGGTSYAVPSVFATDNEWKIVDNGGTAVISKSDGINPDLIISGGDLVLAPGKASGTITGAPKRISANPVTIAEMRCNGFFLFNKSMAGGSATNSNVPDANAEIGDENPDRLSYEMRWTDNDIQPGSDTDWINANQGTPGNFMRFEWNKQPVFDNNGFGNGSASFVSTGVTSPVSAMWIQRRITLRNNYV